jgi:hypothetical protein
MRPIYILGAILLLSSCKPDYSKYIINVGDRIHHDDFEYSVSDYLVTRFLKNGSDTLYAKGVFYVVTFRVNNEAMRVSHEWNNSTAYIFDERGAEYENDSEAQKFYESCHPFGLKKIYKTAAGSSDSTILIFDLPFNVTKPGLKVRGDFLMGDLFDGAKFRKMLVRLF